MELDFYFDPTTHEYTVGDFIVPSVTEICSPITATLYSGGAGVLKAATARGTRVHEICELYDYGMMPDEIEHDAIGYVKAYASFVTDYKPEWEGIEKITVCPSFAGTIDRFGLIDGKRCVVDLKTTTSMSRQSKLSLACQISGYSKLLNYNGVSVDYHVGFGVQLHADGHYTIHSVRKIEELFGFNAADLFDQLQEINNLIKGYNL